MVFRRRASLTSVITAIVIALITGACGGSSDAEPGAATTVLVWVPGGVSDRLTENVSGVQGVTRITEVLGGTLKFVSSADADGRPIEQTTDRRSIPLDTLAYDPETFRDFTDPATAEVLSALGTGDAILGATSARLRGIGVGVTLTLESGDSLTVRQILDDDLVAAGEVVVSPEAAKGLKVDTRRFEHQGLGDTVDSGGYSGCYYPRPIAGLPYVSRHSWGIALDLNIDSDERGRDVEFAPELVDAMSRAGFTSGADWPFPDPAHFEYVPSGAGPPD